MRIIVAPNALRQLGRSRSKKPTASSDPETKWGAEPTARPRDDIGIQVHSSQSAHPVPRVSGDSSPLADGIRERLKTVFTRDTESRLRRRGDDADHVAPGSSGRRAA